MTAETNAVLLHLLQKIEGLDCFDIEDEYLEGYADALSDIWDIINTLQENNQ